MPISFSLFKKAFLKKSKEVQDDLAHLSQLLPEVASLGGEDEQFMTQTLKLAEEFQKVQSDTESKGSYKKACDTLKKLKKNVELKLKGVKTQIEFKKVKLGKDEGLPGKNFNLSSIPGFDKMNESQQKSVKLAIFEKLKKGKELSEKLFDKDFNPRRGDPPSREDLANFLWYIKTLAENKQNEPSARGALTIPDPGNKLRKYFGRVEGMYYRVSTHIEEQGKNKKVNVQGGKTARGFDFYEGETKVDEDGNPKKANWKYALPYGMKTCVLQSVDSGDNRLYLKMEPHGAALGGNLVAIKGKETGKNVGEQSRKYVREDVSRQFHHVMELLPHTDETGLSAFREQTPHEDLKSYDDLLGHLDDIGDEKAKKIMTQGYKPFKVGLKDKIKTLLTHKTKEQDEQKSGSNRMRIFQMVKNARAALQDKAVAPETKDAIQDLLDKLLSRYPDADDRFGGETVLDASDLGVDVSGGTTKDEDAEIEELLGNHGGSPDIVVDKLLKDEKLMKLLPKEEKTALEKIGSAATNLAVLSNKHKGEELARKAKADLNKLNDELPKIKNPLGDWLEDALDPLRQQLPKSNLEDSLDKCHGSPEIVVSKLMDQDALMNELSTEEMSALTLIGYTATELTKFLEADKFGEELELLSADKLNQLMSKLEHIKNPFLGPWLIDAMNPLIDKIVNEMSKQ